MVDRSGTRQFWTTIGKRLVADVRAKNLTEMSQQIVYNILFSLEPPLIFLTAFCGFVAQTVNADSANPVKPVIERLNANLPREAAAFLREPVE